jgi:predicted Fe-Mo cluster-binding NifX family protein
MKIAVTASGPGLEAPASQQFGRCAYFVIVDTDTMVTESVRNPAQAAAGGAGIQAAQFLADKAVGAVISGIYGPNAHQALSEANIPMFAFSSKGTVGQAVEAYQSGRLGSVSAASGPAHSGMPWASGPGAGRGRGAGGRGGRGRLGLTT